MKLFIQYRGWSGTTIAVAETPEQATEIALKTKNSDYDANKPWDDTYPLDKPLHIDIIGE